MYLLYKLLNTESRTLVSAPAQYVEALALTNLIEEHYVNYVLMYNMLTGIRIAVSMSIPKCTCPLITVSRCRSVKPRFGGY